MLVNTMFGVHNILLVEDSCADRELIQVMLMQNNPNYVVHFASGLAEIPKLLEDTLFSVILLDLGLPESIGLETVSSVQKISPDIPLIVLTDAADDVQRLNAAELGVQDYLYKRELTAENIRKAVFYAIERHKLQEALKCALRDANAANKAKGRFLANMSHEIRTPMNGIMGFAQLLSESEELSKTERQEYADIIVKSSEYLMTMINDVLDVAKGDATTVKLQKREFAFEDLIKECVVLFALHGQEKNIIFNTHIDARMPEAVIADYGKLRQIICNLLNNAFKFTHKGSVSMHVDIEYDTTSVCNIVLKVIDTGIGIAEDKLSVLFEPFVQADESISREFGGTGLGLAITKQFVSTMGGNISVMSQPSQGSTFEIRLGLEKVMQKIDNTRNVFSMSAPLKGKRILVVDDTLVNNSLLSIMLKEMHADVVSVFNGEEAIEIVQQQPFDIICMDILMPVLNGFEATKRIRELQEEGNLVQDYAPTIIAVTAMALADDLQKCLNAGMDDYISKPIKMLDLKRVLSKHILKSNHQENIQTKIA